MNKEPLGQGGLQGPVFGAIMAAVVGVSGFLASDFIGGRDHAVAALEARLSASIADLKTEMRDRFDQLAKTTAQDIDNLERRVTDLEGRDRTNGARIEGLTRRIDLQGDILRERTLDKMK